VRIDDTHHINFEKETTMSSFRPGDEVVVTSPVQPTGHRGGETGTVTSVGIVGDATVVQIRDDRDGSLIGVFPDEIRKR
jgi:ribosomal protein L21E